LEDLCQCKLEELTVEKAVEALDGQEKSMWQKFVDGIKALIAKILDWLKRVFTTTNRACDMINNAKGLKGTEIHAKIISYELFKNYPEIVKALDNAVDELSKETDEERAQYDSKFKEAEEAAKKAKDAWWNSDRDIKTEQSNRNPFDFEESRRRWEEAKERNSKLWEEMCAADEKLFKMKSEGSSVRIADKLKHVVSRFSKYLMLDENNVLHVTAEGEPKVYDGASHGYDSIEKVKEVAKIYADNKDKWYRDADSLLARTGAKMVAWAASKQVINSSPFLSEKDVADFKQVIDEEIVMMRGIVFLQQFQNKMKSYMSATLCVLAGQFVTDKEEAAPAEPSNAQ
jgi:hypothetical protein